MFRNGFTLIELLIVLIVLAIIAFLGAVILGALVGGMGTEYNAKVVEKWTDVNFDNQTVYRVQLAKEDDELVTLNSYWVHNDLHKGSYYKVKVFNGSISKATALPQPVEVQNEQRGLAEKP